MKKHKWKIFFKIVIERKLNLVYLIQFKAKAYLMNKHIFKKKNMRVKTYIDFFIKYNNRNIFNI